MAFQVLFLRGGRTGRRGERKREEQEKEGRCPATLKGAEFHSLSVQESRRGWKTSTNETAASGPVIRCGLSFCRGPAQPSLNQVAGPINSSSKRRNTRDLPWARSPPDHGHRLPSCCSRDRVRVRCTSTPNKFRGVLSKRVVSNPPLKCHAVAS